eukprot:CCRYP_015402-RA/>CCRYP_015402-RA protein AED:0.00 eAED:0.00 QI:760/1/1/1/0/0/2/15/269
MKKRTLKQETARNVQLSTNSNINPSNDSKGNAEPLITDQATKTVFRAREGKNKDKRKANCVYAHHTCEPKTTNLDNLINEHYELKRQVHILESVPDLIVAFESSGRVFFVSQSVLSFLGLDRAEDVEGTLFGDWVAADSNALVQTAFMEALEEMTQTECDSVPLAHGRSILIKFVVKNEHCSDETMFLSLKGVVHANGGIPDCVCSIRPISHNIQSKNIRSRPFLGVSIVSEDENASTQMTKESDEEVSKRRAGVSFKKAKVDITAQPS